MTVRPSLGIDGVWTFARETGAAATGLGSGTDDLRARLKGSLGVTGATGWTVRAGAHVDGLGAPGFTEWGGDIAITVPFQ